MIPVDEILDEYEERLMRAMSTLRVLEDEAITDDEVTRLHGKHEGVCLALSYLKEYRR